MQQFVDRTTDDKQIKYDIRKYIALIYSASWFFWWGLGGAWAGGAWWYA